TLVITVYYPLGSMPPFTSAVKEELERAARNDLGPDYSVSVGPAKVPSAEGLDFTISRIGKAPAVGTTQVVNKMGDSEKRTTRLGMVGMFVIVSILTWLGIHFGVKDLLAGSIAVMFALRFVRTPEIRSGLSLVFGMCAGVAIVIASLIVAFGA